MLKSIPLREQEFPVPSANMEKKQDLFGGLTVHFRNVLYFITLQMRKGRVPHGDSGCPPPLREMNGHAPSSGVSTIETPAPFTPLAAGNSTQANSRCWRGRTWPVRSFLRVLNFPRFDTSAHADKKGTGDHGAQEIASGPPPEKRLHYLQSTSSGGAILPGFPSSGGEWRRQERIDPGKTRRG